MFVESSDQLPFDLRHELPRCGVGVFLEVSVHITPSLPNDFSHGVQVLFCGVLEVCPYRIDVASKITRAKDLHFRLLALSVWLATSRNRHSQWDCTIIRSFG